MSLVFNKVFIEHLISVLIADYHVCSLWECVRACDLMKRESESFEEQLIVSYLAPRSFAAIADGILDEPW